jgi:hypothetical protein
MPKVSLIIPTYDRPRLLARAVESARAASADVEIIVLPMRLRGTYFMLLPSRARRIESNQILLYHYSNLSRPRKLADKTGP